MMVTALGTAAKANFSNKSMTSPENIKADRITNELFNYYKQKKKYIIESENKTLRINEEFWNFVKSNKVSELAKYLLITFLEFSESIQDFQKDELNRSSNHLSEYLSLIDSDIATACVYDTLMEDQNRKTREKLVEKIIELQLIDYNRIIDLINEQDFNIQKCGVQILNADKISYER